MVFRGGSIMEVSRNLWSKFLNRWNAQGPVWVKGVNLAFGGWHQNDWKDKTTIQSKLAWTCPFLPNSSEPTQLAPCTFVDSEQQRTQIYYSQYHVVSKLELELFTSMLSVQSNTPHVFLCGLHFIRR
jgi:hypothetical protein